MKRLVYSSTNTWVDPELLNYASFDPTGEEMEDLWQKYLADPETEVCDEFQIMAEPSVQLGRGAMFIMDDSGQERFEPIAINWSKWCENEIQMVIDSSNAEEYKQKFRSYIQDICKFENEVTTSIAINAALDPAVNKALNTARSDARNAMRRWHQSKDLGIDTILNSMGYATSSRLSSYEMYRSVVSYSSGYSKLYAVINYYNLIIGKEHNMTVYVTDSIMDGKNLSGTKVVKDNYYA